MDDDGTAVIHQAERIIFQASWRVQEEVVLDGMAGTRGLHRAPLEPRSDVIQLVTYDGEHLGHVRREGPRGPEERWVAVLKLPGRAVGSYGDAQGAAAALARASGIHIPKRC
jgi:hypothetical protein